MSDRVLTCSVVHWVSLSWILCSESLSESFSLSAELFSVIKPPVKSRLGLNQSSISANQSGIWADGCHVCVFRAVANPTHFFLRV